MAKRLAKFRLRIPGFSMLSRARISRAKLLRTGGIQAKMFGAAANGIADIMLHAQRTTAAKAAATSAGTCGQNLDLALIMADAANNGRGDPAFEAHKSPIATWALAVWETWLPEKVL